MEPFPSPFWGECIWFGLCRLMCHLCWMSKLAMAICAWDFTISELQYLQKTIDKHRLETVNDAPLGGQVALISSVFCSGGANNFVEDLIRNDAVPSHLVWLKRQYENSTLLGPCQRNLQKTMVHQGLKNQLLLALKCKKNNTRKFS